MEPDQFQEVSLGHTFLSSTDSQLLVPCVPTCTKSLLGRVIDFGIMSISLLPILQAIDVVNTPTVPHLGVVVRLKRSAKQVRTRSLVVPKELHTPPDECVDGGRALCWYEDHEAPVPNAREYVTACAAYGDFHKEHAAQDAVIDITHRFRRWAHTLEFSHCQASDYPHEGRMGRGGQLALRSIHSTGHA